MHRIFVPPHAGVLSALGLAITSERRERMISVLARADAMDASSVRDALERSAHDVCDGDDWEHNWTARMRYVGQGHELDVTARPGDDGAALSVRFSALHNQRNGFTLDAATEVIGIRYVASGAAHPVTFSRLGTSAWDAEAALDDGSSFDAYVVGPSVVTLPGATLRITSGWSGVPHPTGGWMLTRAGDIA